MSLQPWFRLAVFSVSFASPAWADIVDDYFEKLRTVPARYDVFGKVCEQVARQELRQSYPDADFKLVTGIEYRDSRRTLGELDVVVFERGKTEAIIIAEVKCWKDLEGAMDKAVDQLNRFETTMEQDEIITLSGEGEKFRMDQFDESPQFMTISQKGGETAGFDISLPLDLDQMGRLYDRLRKCQKQGKCPRG